VETRVLDDWHIVVVRGRFVAGEPEKKFLDEIRQVLGSGARRVVVDLTGASLADDSVATAATDAYRQAKTRGTEIRFVVQPGKAGGYYHMAGLEMMIPTYAHLDGAIQI
jgi:anti-anti-sigma regulatory factor